MFGRSRVSNPEPPSVPLTPASPLPANGRVRTMRTRRRGERGRVGQSLSNKILPSRTARPALDADCGIADCERACHPPGAKSNPVPSPRGRCGVDLPEWKSAGRGDAGVRGSQGTISRGVRSEKKNSHRAEAQRDFFRPSEPAKRGEESPNCRILQTGDPSLTPTPTASLRMTDPFSSGTHRSVRSICA
jgi:hypothetical protein